MERFYTRLALVLAGFLIASSAHAQAFDANGKLQANVFALQCQEMPRVDAELTRRQADLLIGTFGYGFMHGYFTGRIHQFNNPNDRTPQEQAYAEHLRPIYSDWMTDTSVDVVAARLRTFCSDRENATKTMTEAIVIWLLKIDK